MKIGLSVPEKIFEGFLPYMGVAATLVMLVPEKIRFDFLYEHDLGSWSRNDLDLQYSHTFILSIICLLLPTFRSLAAIVSEEKKQFSIFPMIKPKLQNLNLLLNRSRSTKGRHFNTL